MKGVFALEIHSQGMLQLPASVLTIGALDGVHRGHQMLLQKAKERAKFHNVPLVVYTFDPPPKVYLQRCHMITTLEEKLFRLEKMGADHVIVAKFNREFMNQSAEQFIDEIKQIHPIEIWEGPNFKFGKNRSGTIERLQQHFYVGILEPITCEKGERISSTRIRHLIKKGNYKIAEKLLGNLEDQLLRKEKDVFIS